MTERRIFRITGKDTKTFLQDLITNDIGRLEKGIVYAALLTPQGKFIADFFLVPGTDMVLIDVHVSVADTLIQRLRMYKLRADVSIEPEDLHLHQGLGPAPEDGFVDPRHQELGWRAYRDTAAPPDNTDWTALRVRLLIPETGIELTADTFILEAGFERLNGVDFRKGCYVGQEVTARMKHKTELRKGLARVAIDGDAETGTPVLSEGKPAGHLLSVAGDEGIAYLRFDRATGPMQAGEAKITRIA